MTFIPLRVFVDNVKFCDGLECVYVKYKSVHQQYVNYLINTWVLAVKTWLLIACDTAFMQYCDLVYKFKRIVRKPNFIDQFKKSIKRYKKFGNMWQSAYNHGLWLWLRHHGGSGRLWRKALKMGGGGGAWCLSGPTVLQLEVFFSSDYLWVVSSS